MAVLTASELVVIDNIKKLAKAAISRDALVRETCVLLKTVIPFNSAAFFHVNPNTLEFTGAHLDNLDRGFLSLYFQKFYKRDNTALGFRELPKGGYVSKQGSDLVALKPDLCWPVYQELLSKFDCHFSLATGFDVNGECFGYLILWRTRTGKDFLKKHTEMMQMVAPSIAHALKGWYGEQRLLEVINRRPHPGVLILDPKNNLLYKNEEAQSILYHLSKNRGYSVHNGNGNGNGQPGTVPVEILNICRKLRTTLAEGHADKTTPISYLASTIVLGLEAYSIKALSLDNDRESGEPSLIVVVVDNSRLAQRFDLEKVRVRYDLTFKENEVVHLLFEGHTYKEIAKELCIGAYTLETYLKNIREKMGVDARKDILSKVIHDQTAPPVSNLGRFSFPAVRDEKTEKH